MYDDFEIDFPICLAEAENDIIWTKEFKYKKWGKSTRKETTIQEDDDYDIPF